ncbi:MAG TPA: DinB family protein [Candidatus Limnocylindrales bacterium]|nr:DinB family protein [Candidatus Limnocylindrales bacterium]
MDATERAALIAGYADGAAEVERALGEIGPAGLDRRPPDGSWTAREVVHHLADSEMRSAIRLRRLIAEDEPEILGYDEAGYARIFRYADRPIEPALDALRAARATTLQILDQLGEADWRRRGRHSESGEYGVEAWLRIYAAHAHEHADQIRRAAGA